MVKAAPVNAEVFGLIKVIVKVLLAPAATLLGLNARVRVGGCAPLISLLLIQTVCAAVWPVKVMLLSGLRLPVFRAGVPVTAVALNWSAPCVQLVTFKAKAGFKVATVSKALPALKSSVLAAVKVKAPMLWVNVPRLSVPPLSTMLTPVLASAALNVKLVPVLSVIVPLPVIAPRVLAPLVRVKLLPAPSASVPTLVIEGMLCVLPLRSSVAPEATLTPVEGKALLRPSCKLPALTVVVPL